MVAPHRPPTSPPARWSRLAAIDELRGDGPFPAAVDGVDLVVIRSRGALRVLDGRCPHQGALLAEGELDRGQLVCRNHRWRFDPGTGARHGGPGCLRPCPTEIRAGALWADVAALDQRTAAPVIGRRLTDLPGPRGLALLGSALSMTPARTHQIVEDWATRYGSTYLLRIARRRFVVTREPALIAQALRSRPEAFRRDGRFEPVFRELGVAGVFVAEGRAWRPQRRLAMEALSQRNLRSFYPTLALVADRLRRRWAAAADRGEPVDLIDDLMRFTVDVTTALVFGHDLDTLNGGRDVIQRHLEQMFPAVARRISAVIPWWRFVRFPVDRRTDRAVAALRSWLGELVTTARAAMAADPGRSQRPANFLEAMLAARDDDGRPFDDDTIFSNAVTMLLAGEDTTATTVAWAVHHLLDLPDEIAALRAELDAVVGAAAVPADHDSAARLERAAAVAQEAMRLRPVAPVLFLEANHDLVLGDSAMPAGTGLILLVRPSATDGAYFAEPERFSPGRWIDPGTAIHEPSVHVPFGAGPRICPGRGLAMLEMRVMLATLFHGFDVERIGNADDVHERFAFVMAPDRVTVRLRHRARP